MYLACSLTERAVDGVNLAARLIWSPWLRHANQHCAPLSELYLPFHLLHPTPCNHCLPASRLQLLLACLLLQVFDSYSCPASECMLFCKDMWEAKHRRIFMNPRVRFTYNFHSQVSRTAALSIPCFWPHAEGCTGL